MSDVLPWLEYKWSFDFPAGMYRAILERLRGTPARLEEMLRDASTSRLTGKKDGKWSVLEEVGHLWVLEDELHRPRVEQFLRGETALMAADMSNKVTFERNFNAVPAAEVVAGFRTARRATLALLDPLTLADAARAALHPRLQKQMRLVDLCYFAAEHDDHHLAVIKTLL